MFVIRLAQTLGTGLEELLALSVDPDIRDHWDKKILGGIVPTEVLLEGPLDKDHHDRETERLATFEVDTVQSLYENKWGNSAEGGDLHYFGIGEAKALKRVTLIANKHGSAVKAYDVSSVACQRAEDVFQEVASEGGQCENVVLAADIEAACRKKFILPPRSKRRKNKIIASRVWDVLDKQDKNWECKPQSKRKMARTARRMGRLLPWFDVLLIHPDAKDNPNAIWGDSTPYHLETLLEFIQEGAPRMTVKMTRLGTIDFHRHIYTAVLVSNEGRS